MTDKFRRDEKPWFRQFWPWFIISLPLAAVVASIATLWIAISNPDIAVLNKQQSRAINSQLKAQPAADANPENTAGNSDKPASH